MNCKNALHIYHCQATIKFYDHRHIHKGDKSPSLSEQWMASKVSHILS